MDLRQAASTSVCIVCAAQIVPDMSGSRTVVGGICGAPRLRSCQVRQAPPFGMLQGHNTCSFHRKNALEYFLEQAMRLHAVRRNDDFTHEESSDFAGRYGRCGWSITSHVAECSKKW